MTADADRRRPRPHRSSRPGAWLRWVIPAVLVVVWLAIGGIGGPYTGKLSEVQKNDNASFLPSNAEATEVSNLQAKFSDQQVLPTFLVVEAPGGLSQQQLGAVRDLAQKVPSLPIEVSGAPSADLTVGDYLAPGPIAVVPSQDGKAALVPLPLDQKSSANALPDGKSPVEAVVKAVRGAAHGQLDATGVSTYVTGVGGQLADLVKAFGALDVLLLGVALLVVLVILLIVYRSPILPFVVLAGSVFGLGLAGLVVYVLAKNDVLTLNGQSQGILSILVVGAATDYSLLLVARYREELRRHEDRAEAMVTAYKRAFEPIAASALTVALGVLCLVFSDLNSNKSLGPVAAIGIVAALLAGVTFVPAVLTLLGRAAFWPFRPKYGSESAGTRGIWARIAGLVGSRPRLVWVATAIVLGILAAFLPTFKADGVSQSDLFLTKVESVQGQKALARHFPAGSGSPALIIATAEQLPQVLDVAKSTPGVQSVVPVPAKPAAPGGGSPTGGQGGAQDGQGGQVQPKVVDGLVEVQATLSDAADSPAAEETVQRLRERLDTVGTNVLVGGTTAIALDVRETSKHDLATIIPIVLAVVFVVLALLLRSLVAPLLLVLANVLSFGATLGASALVFDHVLGFPGADPAVPLYAFVFLVALGVDYSIFLMTRVREESVKRGTRPGVRIGLAVTGGVITSAGVVLAATFGSLSVVPILFLAQIAFIVAFGVLLDTLVVRSLLVPALAYDLDSRVWWPSRLSRRPAPTEAEPERESAAA